MRSRRLEERRDCRSSPASSVHGVGVAGNGASATGAAVGTGLCEVPGGCRMHRDRDTGERACLRQPGRLHAGAAAGRRRIQQVERVFDDCVRHVVTGDQQRGCRQGRDLALLPGIRPGGNRERQQPVDIRTHPRDGLGIERHERKRRAIHRDLELPPRRGHDFYHGIDLAFHEQVERRLRRRRRRCSRCSRRPRPPPRAGAARSGACPKRLLRARLAVPRGRRSARCPSLPGRRCARARGTGSPPHAGDRAAPYPRTCRRR